MSYEADEGINSTPLTSECYTKWAYFTVSQSTLGSTESCTPGCGVWSQKTEKSWPDKLRYSYWEIFIYHETQWSLLIISFVSFGLEVHEHFNNIWQHDVCEYFCSQVDKTIQYFIIVEKMTLMIDLITAVTWLKYRKIISNQSINWFYKHKLHQS